jgi:hypothetical protein
MTITTASDAISTGSRTVDHRTSSTYRGGPASRYRRVERPNRGLAAGPNFLARRVGAAIVAIGAVFVMAALLNGVLVSFGGSPASAAEATPAGVEAGRSVAHVARPGDSLWSIADEHRGGVDRDRYVDALIALNGSSVIQVGQAIHLP